MDLGIRGRKAIICAASEGLGRACALALARAGVDLVINARRPDVLEATADEVRRETGGVVNLGRCDPLILAPRERHRQGTGVDLFP
jgi:3-oxoacyl-[acyl-carrier protein] reductase